MTNPQPTVPAAMIVPATGAPVTAPPASPWYLAAKRAVQLIIPVLPIITTVLLDALSKGTITIDPKWAGFMTTLLICIQVVAKQQKEQGRQNDALQLQAQGIPAGVPLTADHLERVLHTEATLPR
jgi:hypothetical protein